MCGVPSYREGFDREHRKWTVESQSAVHKLTIGLPVGRLRPVLQLRPRADRNLLTGGASEHRTDPNQQNQLCTEVAPHPTMPEETQWCKTFQKQLAHLC
ncbi:hypothetical protein J6590_079765 [Homalodisca vitripennis]|nr:hypothetical protein J6590_095862 [Homalodisca vitripennis]KAG8275767.1 hypothetical protein J6590_079765 [Homalodisca vitripennis]